MSDRHKTKSQGLQLVLSVLFGPLGLLYSSVPGAVLLSLAAVWIAKDAPPLGFLPAWPLAIVTGYFTVRHWNRRALERAHHTAKDDARPLRHEV